MAKHVHAQNILKKTLAAIDGGQAELARKLAIAANTKCAPALVYQWSNGLRPIAPRWAIPFETVSAGVVTRQDVAPAVFGKAANNDKH